VTGRAGRALRVLHLDTQRGWRGGERQAFWLARALAASGHHSAVAARPDEPLAAAARDAGLEVIACEPLASADPLAATRLRRRLVQERVDILHAHTANAVTLGAMATVRTDTRLVVTRRVDFPLNPGAGTRWKYARAAAVIAISQRVREVMLASGIQERRMVVIPDGVDLARPMTPASPVRLAGLGVRPGVALVVMVAALVGHKDPLTFVRAVAAARDAGARFQALLAGDGFLRDAVRREHARLALGDHLLLAGWQEEADALIAAADVVVLSSSEEGQGSVLLDAMQCAKPVAATSAGGIPDVVVDGETGLLVPPGDPAALGEAIARLCRDRGLRARLGAAGAQRAGRFAIERVADETLDVYRRVLASPR
jgi:glycosyltransferase involved in cell wall biosynthesis